MSERPRSVQPSPAEPVPDDYDLFCEGCGYSLIGLMGSNRCPECGLQFDPTVLPLARVPWLFRKRLGTWNAYFKTVWQVLRSPTSFAAELYRPVRISVLDAAAFRRRTVLINSVFFTLAILLLTLQAIGPRMVMTGQLAALLLNGAVLAVCSHMGLWIFLMLITDMPTFIWRGLDAGPQRLAPAHHYAAAPLVLLPALAISAGVADALLFVVGRSYDPQIMMIAPILGAFALYIVLFSVAAGMMAASLSGSIVRRVALFCYLPLHYAIMMPVAFAVFGISFRIGMGLLELAGLQLR